MQKHYAQMFYILKNQKDNEMKNGKRNTPRVLADPVITTLRISAIANHQQISVRHSARTGRFVVHAAGVGLKRGLARVDGHTDRSVSGYREFQRVFVTARGDVVVTVTSGHGFFRVRGTLLVLPSVRVVGQALDAMADDYAVDLVQGAGSTGHVVALL